MPIDMVCVWRLRKTVDDDYSTATAAAGDSGGGITEAISDNWSR